MKLLHLADLHLGKTLHDLSLIDSGDQPFWVEQLLAYAAAQKPDAVLIAGDVYDRSIPAKNAVPLLTRLLTGLADQGLPVLLVAGNHDGGERLAFAAELLSRQSIHIAGPVQKELTRVTLTDEHGPVDFWLMPYLYPAAVNSALGREENELHSYDEAARALLAVQPLDPARRNVLIAHQLVLAGEAEPEHSASETSIGGVGQIDVSAFDAFDYVALGHIHGAQTVGRPTVRYAGSPLCYHFSEIGQKKGPLLVELGPKGSEPTFTADTLPVLHPLRQLKGDYAEVLAQEERCTASGEYLRIVLTDDHLDGDAVHTLRALAESHGSRLLDLAREPKRLTRTDEAAGTPGEELALDELFTAFYRSRNGEADPEEKEQALIRHLAQQITEGRELAEEEAVEDLIRFALAQEENV